MGRSHNKRVFSKEFTRHLTGELTRQIYNSCVLLEGTIGGVVVASQPCADPQCYEVKAELLALPSSTSIEDLLKGGWVPEKAV